MNLHFLPTLDEFLRSELRNSYVLEYGFASLYVRKSRRTLGGVAQDTIDLANVEAIQPGRGALKALVARLTKDYPERTIFVENVLSDRFVAGLRRMGFVIAWPGAVPPSFYLPR